MYYFTKIKNISVIIILTTYYLVRTLVLVILVPLISLVNVGGINDLWGGGGLVLNTFGATIGISYTTVSKRGPVSTRRGTSIYPCIGAFHK